MTVPLAAMIDSNRSAVFVVTPENTLERRAVKTGADDGTYVEIVWGIKEGETVVTSASEGLKEGMKVELTLMEGDGK